MEFIDEYADVFMPGGWPEDAMPAAAPREATPAQDGQIIVIDGEEVFIPDSPRPARAELTQAPRQEAADQDPTYNQELTADVCLSRMLDIFPDIDHDHVLKMHKDYAFVPSPGGARGSRFETMVEKIMTGGSYPKQAKLPPARKRKREEEDIDQVPKKWEAPDRPIAPAPLKGAMASILKADFPEITKAVITQELLTGKHLYQSYLALANMKDSSDVNKKWTGRASLKDLASADTIATNCGWPTMTEELKDAREHVKTIRRRRVIEDAKKWEEKENLQRAIDSNETAECQACFDDLPMNRQIHCDGETAHFTCFDCATAYVKSEVGDSRCRVLCTAGCGAPFARAQLHMLADKELLNQLEQLQQEKDIRDAGLDDLEECPFCDYKAILPPVEEDFEFRCANEECEKISCRRCKAVSHIPMSCEEHAKENKLSVRHRIEEAMTAALIRNCSKCKKGFIKEYGCNKMVILLNPPSHIFANKTTH
jgi:TRIAD3 protein (E3 ubiquitin-protein ligase RNF216)